MFRMLRWIVITLALTIVAADANFAINNATGTFSIIKTIDDGTGAQQFVVAPGAVLGVTPTDKGGTITLGGTAQTLAAANTSRKAITIQNPCTLAGQGGIAALEDLYISVTGNATVAGAGNYADLSACASTNITFSGQVYTGAITVIGATTGHRWSATEFQ